MPTASSIPENCPHERRPGLTVCLHCRHAAREAELAKRRSSLARLGIVGAVIGLGAMLATAAVRSREHAAATSVATLAAAEGASEVAGSTATAPVAAAPVSALPATDAARDTSVAAGGTTLAPQAAPAESERAPAPTPAADVAPVVETVPSPALTAPSVPVSAAPLGPVVAPGTTELPEGLSVVRAGDSLTVHFDTELGRTRRPEKFERIVRATLPMIYGATADSLLADVPAGAIAGAGELLTELPARGVRIPTADGRTLLVRPETRPGRDGPLVVRYIATVER